MLMTDPVSPIGNIIALKGQVWAESESGVRPLETGSPVYQGDKIVTGPDSNAEIRFLDDTCLSQGADSALSLDQYVYNPADEAASNLGFGLLQGAFRHVSGKIATTNPENVQLESPLAVIGIRGTVTVHSVNPVTGDETHGVEHISDGHRVIIQDSFGEIRIISDHLTVIDLSPDAPMGFIRPMTPQELEFFQSFAPGVLELFGVFMTPEGLFALLGGVPGGVLSGAGGEGAGESGGDATGGSEGSNGGTEASSGIDATEAGQQTADPEGSASGPAAGMSTVGIAPYTDQSYGTSDFGLFGTPGLLAGSESGAGGSSGSDLLPPPGTPDGGDSSLFGAASSYPQQESLLPPPQEPTGSAPSYSEPSHWEYMGSGGHPNYTWLPAGYTVFSGTDDADALSPEGTGSFALFGFGGDDYLAASDNHMFYGGAGNDTIVGSAGADTIHGGSGDDVIIVQGAGDAANDIIDGGSGSNTLRIMAGSHIENVFASDAGLKNIASIELLGDASGVDLSAQSEAFLIESNVDREVVILSGSGNDTIIGAVDYGNTIHGGGGDDSLVGGDDDDSLNGGLGNDTISGGAGVDSMSGGDGNDVFIFRAGDVASGEIIDGGEGTDMLWMDESVDFRGAQILNIEHVSIQMGSTATFDADVDQSTWTVKGGGGTETFRVVLGTGGEQVDLSGLSFLDWTGSDLVSVQGGLGNDTILGSAVNNFIDGGSGNDSLDCGPGNDTILGGAGDDSLYGGAGNDSLVGGDGNDTIEGAAGADTLTGDAGNDEFVYTSLSDSRTGDGVDTIVDFTPGEDKIRFVELSTKTTFVYRGSDAFVVGDHAQARLDGNMLLIDVDGNGTEDMRILLSNAPSLTQDDFVWVASGTGPSPDDNPDNWELRSQYAVDVDIIWLFNWFKVNTPTYWFSSAGDTGNNIVLNYDNFPVGYDQNQMSAVFSFGGNDTIDASHSLAATYLYGGAGNDSVVGGVGNDTIYGGTGNDTIIGGSGNDWLDGGDGDDWLDGYDGHNTIYGGSGHDTIYGRNGHDWIDGGADNDWILGGWGNDTIYGGSGNDTIYGGDGIGNLWDGDNWIDGGEGDDVIVGGHGDDTIYGGPGADTLTGGEGADVFFFSAGSGDAIDVIDMIMDFNSGEDKIQTDTPGTVTNYSWADFGGTGGLLDVINNANTAFSGDPNFKYYFAQNVSGDSYLVIDWDGDHTADQAVMLVATTAFDHSDII
jgi:Ca2+-binding RTX toxin-like protein